MFIKYPIKKKDISFLTALTTSDFNIEGTQEFKDKDSMCMVSGLKKSCHPEKITIHIIHQSQITQKSSSKCRVATNSLLLKILYLAR